MNSVTQSRAGVASGVNNAVSRTAGLLAIAVLGIVMLQTFAGSLRRELPNDLQKTVVSQTDRLAAIELPPELGRGAPQRRQERNRHRLCPWLSPDDGNCRRPRAGELAQRVAAHRGQARGMTEVAFAARKSDGRNQDADPRGNSRGRQVGSLAPLRRYR